jgi:hypothetical protein
VSDDETAASLADKLDVIARAAPGLRTAGVLDLVMPGLTLRLAPPDPPPMTEANRAALDEQISARRRSSDPLDDPDTFMGGVVPKYPGIDERVTPRGRSYQERDEHDDD